MNESYIFGRKGDLTDAEYREMKEDLEQQIVTVEMKINDAKQDEIDIEELLDFTENLLLDAATEWNRSELAGKQRIQQVLFPHGVTYAEGIYRTTATNPMFSMLEGNLLGKGELVALPGIEPGFED